ncbi:MAG: hypothetical protein NC318_06360 [Blautia sp.]|nr:hypothetical protein [Lachnoclostridium sp.]MCM1211207.1 hypothetical protein [Blautia sp.]
MAKKFGKFLMTTATLGALAAGAYYFLKKNDVLTEDSLDDEDDYDDFDDDLDDEESAGNTEADRKYVDLDLTKAADTADKTEEKAEEASEGFKEGLTAAKAEAKDKIVGTVEKAASDTEEKVEEFFDDEDASDENDNSSDAM